MKILVSLVGLGVTWLLRAFQASGGGVHPGCERAVPTYPARSSRIPGATFAGPGEA